MSTRKKMSRQDLIDLFPAYSRPSKTETRATAKGHVHKVNPVWMPPKAKQTPAQWHRAQRKLRDAAKRAVKK